MSDQQELAKVPELVLFEIVKSVQGLDQSQPGRIYIHPMTGSDSYNLDSIIRVPYNISLTEIIGHEQSVRDFWPATPESPPQFYKQVALGLIAVVLGTLIGVITPWLTSSLEQLFW